MTDDQDRIDRVRGKRNSRPGRRGRDDEGGQEDEQEVPEASEEQEETESTEMQDTQSDTTTASAEKADETEPGETPEGQEATDDEQGELPSVTSRPSATYYLSKDVTDELDRVYRRMSLDLLEEVDVDLDDVGGRNRYFRPLALLLGARQLREMSPDEVVNAVEDEDLVDPLPREDG